MRSDTTKPSVKHRRKLSLLLLWCNRSAAALLPRAFLGWKACSGKRSCLRNSLAVSIVLLGAGGEIA